MDNLVTWAVVLSVMILLLAVLLVITRTVVPP